MTELRNGGFEHGDISFWGCTTGGSRTIEAGVVNSGTYSLKFTSSGDANEIVFNEDYIPVRPYALVNTGLYVKSAASRAVAPIVLMYDSDYSYLGYATGNSRTMDNTWMSIIAQHTLDPSTAYVRFGVMVYGSNADEIFYLDTCSFDTIKRDDITQSVIRIVSLMAEGSNGDTDGDRQDLQMYKTFYADLKVVYAGGTNPTLDVTIYEKTKGNADQLVGTFAQKIAAGAERIALTNCTGRQLFAKWTIGGTSPSFSAYVDLTGEA